MTFLQWLYSQRGRGDEIGAFADLATTDKSGRKPRIHHSREDWAAHLAENEAPAYLLTVLDTAWDEWNGNGQCADLGAIYCGVEDRMLKATARRLAGAFANMTGWRPARGARACPAPLVDRRHKGQDCEYCETYHFDHAEAWRGPGGMTAMVFHPYDQHPKEFWPWCRRMGLECTTFLKEADWYYPGSTHLCVLTAYGSFLGYDPLAAIGYEYYS